MTRQQLHKKQYTPAEMQRIIEKSRATPAEVDKILDEIIKIHKPAIKELAKR